MGHKRLTLCYSKSLNIPVYFAREVDKVIAEKDTKIKGLEKCEQWMRDHFFCEEIAATKERHHKYKRCLNNAWWILREEFYAEDCHCERWVNWAIRWYKRWMELANKFKEAK